MEAVTQRQNKIGKGFNSFDLKVIALVLMTFDHIHYYFSGLLEVPSFFSLIGRISAPLFLFAMAQGFSHTHSKISYLKRLYTASVLMQIGNYLVNRFYPHPAGSVVMNGIFSTIFLIGFFIFLLERLGDAIRKGLHIRAFIASILLLLPFLLNGLVFYIMSSEELLQKPLAMFFIMAANVIIPMPFLAEGSIIFIIVGIGLYFFRNQKAQFSVFYIAISAFFFLTALSGGFSFDNLFILNNQWFMIFSLPFMLLYNGEKGRGMKYFFYFYYPGHVYLFVAFARLLAGA